MNSTVLSLMHSFTSTYAISGKQSNHPPLHHPPQLKPPDGIFISDSSSSGNEEESEDEYEDEDANATDGDDNAEPASAEN